MSKVGIVTDSTNCLPPELIKKYGVRVVPVCMVINGKVYRDLIDISLAEFKDISKLRRYLTQGASVKFEAFLRGAPGQILSLF